MIPTANKGNGSPDLVANILSLAEAARAVPAMDGRRPHTASIWRWCRKGIVRNAKRVTLRYVRVGRRIGIPADALNEFFVALAEADRTEDASPIERAAAQCRVVIPKGRSDKQRQRDIDRAKAELARVGV
jgi:hypothetical protein